MCPARERPDYPFSEANLERSLHRTEQFLADPPLTNAERVELLEFVRLTGQFAFLERLIQGEVLFEIPAHYELMAGGAIVSETLVEQLATEERSSLGLGMSPAETLAEMIDARGIKVFVRDREVESGVHLSGAFDYCSDDGPGILVGAPGGGNEQVFILAHEYAHLVIDIDPYRSRFCRWSRGSMENSSTSQAERLADRFARALLLPAELIGTIRGDAARVAGDGAGAIGDGTAAEFTRVAEALGVTPPILARRLADLDPGSAPLQAAPSEMAPGERATDDLLATGLPERFVNLALAAFGRRIFDKNELSRFLRIPPDEVDRFLAWCPVPRKRRPRRGGAR